jgi:hypothetical protein
MAYVVCEEGKFHLGAYHPLSLQHLPTEEQPLIEVFIQLLWIIECSPILYRHFLKLSKNVVVLSLESTVDVITSTTIVGNLLIISILHIIVMFIIISIAHIVVTFIITTASVIIIL